jgi:cysteinyl-tRNA synthetase
MKLFNSLTGRKETFEPAIRGRPTMYVCGPTVWNHPHIGNARPAVVFDVLFRLLKARYGEGVIYARNVTDIEDKIIAAAAAEGVASEVISARYTAAYNGDMAALGVLPPTLEPFATAHVGEMLAMIERLLASGHAYEAEGHVLFHVPSFPEYGRLSRRSREEMIDGARVEVAPYKRDPADFVLWKPSTPEQPGWESRFGRGRPGWHIECSAMVERHLGVTIDIHGGGQDLKFPHHENEIAQSVCAHGGAPLARFWLHNGFVNVEQEKMSKSLGNVLLVRDLVAADNERDRSILGEVVRYTLLMAHYRKPLDWTESAFERAKDALLRLYNPLRLPPPLDPRRKNMEPPSSVREALEDDLNTPEAFAALFDIARRTNASKNEAEKRRLKAELVAGGRMLGILRQDPEEVFKRLGFLAATARSRSSARADLLVGAVDADRTFRREAAIDEAEIERLIAERAAARKARDFARADEIRDRLAGQGVVLEDSAEGTRWRRAG